MSRIEEMIEEMCHDGVEYKRLGDVTVMKRGTSLTKKKAEEGCIPVISGGRQPAFYCNQSNREGETITVAGSGARAGFVQYWNEPIFACDCFTVKGTEALDTRYVYHLMTSMQDAIYSCKKGGGVPHVHISDIDGFEIPVPPLQVQEEIVRILDAFTKLATELTTELAAELAMRTKQYEYYRDELLRLEGVEGMKRKEIAEVSSYEQPGPYIVHSTDYDDEYDTPVLTAGQTFILGYTDETGGIYSASKQRPVILFDDFTGALKWVDFPFKVKSSATKFIKSCDGVMLRYLYYCMCSLDFSSKEHKRLWISKYSHFEIPVPPLSVQQDIVTKLDAFSSYCTDLTTGLPAEIEARNKQYAYYRDMMLSFPMQKNK